MRTRWVSFAVVTVTLLAVPACGASSKKSTTPTTAASASQGSSPSSASGPLVGTFKIDAGMCGAQGISSGSWFRMVQSGATPATGPFVSNSDSPCTDKTWSPLFPGADGGLRTDAYQPFSTPAFDAGGNGTAVAIAKPTKWFAVAFAVGTNPKDPQTGKATPQPSVSVADGKLTADLRSFAAAWNGQHFNQGSPKPDGSRPGSTTAASGTYDAATRHFTLQWTSTILGGPFNNFTGVWHLEGTFVAKTA